MTKKPITRRKALQLTGAATSALAAPFVLRRGASASNRELVVCSWGGSYQAALRKGFFDPFEQETGIRVIDASAPMVANVRAQVESGNIEWDVIEGGTRWYPVLRENDLVEELDASRINTGVLMPEAVESHGIAPLFVSIVLAHNSSHFAENPPRDWVDFWAPDQFPGPRSLGADITYALEFALLADGVPADQLYPIDEDRAFAKLREIRDHVRVWWQQGDQPIQTLSQGEVLMSSSWCGRALHAKEQGLPIDISWNQGAISPSFFMIMKGARHRDEAHEFINFTTRADAQAVVARELFYGPSNTDALELLSEDVRKNLPTHPDNIRVQWPLNGNWLAANYDRVNERWQEFLLGG